VLTASCVMSSNIRYKMLDVGIKTIRELSERLQLRGVKLSYAQLTRIVAGDTESVNLNVLSGLADVLFCSIDEFFINNVSGKSGSGISQTWGGDARERTKHKHILPSIRNRQKRNARKGLLGRHG